MNRAVNFNESLPILEVSSGCIVSKFGDVTVGIKVQRPEIFTLGDKEYTQLHDAYVKVMKLLPPGTIVHLQDIFWEDRWQPEHPTGVPGFLAAASNRFFTGRPFLRHTAYIYLTRRASGHARINSASSGLLRSYLVPPETLDEQRLWELKQTRDQFVSVLTESGLIAAEPLQDENLASSETHSGLIEQYCHLLDNDEPVLRDISFWPGMQIGKRHAVLYTLADAEKVPAQCSPAVPYERYSSDQAKLYVGFMAALGLLLPCNHIVNQYIVIGDSAETWGWLERKRLRMQSLSRYSRSNALAAEAIGDYIDEALAGQQTPVRVHVNVMAWTDHYEQLPQLRSGIVSAITRMNAIPHEETQGAPQLWWAGIPGNAAELPENECWHTLLEQACCFLIHESNYRDSVSTFGIRLGDRLTGKPVHVDLDIEPRRKGWTQNDNLFVLAGSGGGKSFFMNHLCRSYYDQGMHVVLIDVGHSYRTLCSLLGGYYFTYEEARPMRFNPFYLSSNQSFDTEKKESLKSLLMALWKRADEVQYRSEYVAISNALQLYYDHLKTQPAVFPGFDSFYEFMAGAYRDMLVTHDVKSKEFDLENFLYVLRPYYRGGEFDFLLNARENLDLLNARFVVFELDNIKDHPILFPVVTLVIMEVFLSKMRQLRGVRKAIVIEEAWKAIANAGMAENIRYWAKTVRKFMGKLALVSQEVEDIADSPIIKQAIINNADCRILLDQSKFQNNFDQIQSLLGITAKQKAEILSINRGHDPGRPYKDLWIGLGPTRSHVYRLEVSPEEYWAYTSDQAEKLKLEEYLHQYGTYPQAIQALISGF
ncbi:MAG TPA: TraG family conjugative transposon ATPase [Puia sp.]|nr:TraG family conjugative transposon ATPase [Puia sp.]